MDDAELIAKLAFESDLVVHTADADHVVSAKAIVQGLKQKVQETGKRGLYLHTSGTGILCETQKEFVHGEKSEAIYSDEDDLNELPISQPHRVVDMFLVDHSADYDLVLLAPTTIYGEGTGLKEISNRNSIQVPLLIKASIKHKRAQQIGKGRNIWGQVHIEDLTDLYVLLVEKLLKGELKGMGNYSYYFAESGEFAWGDVARNIGEILHKKGVAATAQVEELLDDEAVKKGFGFLEAKFYVGCNSRARADKSRKIGWKPKYGQDGLFKYLPVEVDHYLEQEKAL